MRLRRLHRLRRLRRLSRLRHLRQMPSVAAYALRMTAVDLSCTGAPDKNRRIDEDTANE